jgi:hypothetical protein
MYSIMYSHFIRNILREYSRDISVSILIKLRTVQQENRSLIPGIGSYFPLFVPVGPIHYMRIRVYIYIYIYVCVCVCVHVSVHLLRLVKEVAYFNEIWHKFYVISVHPTLVFFNLRKLVLTAWRTQELVMSGRR